MTLMAGLSPDNLEMKRRQRLCPRPTRARAYIDMRQAGTIGWHRRLHCPVSRWNAQDVRPLAEPPANEDSDAIALSSIKRTTITSGDRPWFGLQHRNTE